MATITSAATGNWVDGGTWVGGIAPGNGDIAIIATGHTITATASLTIGTAPDNLTTYVIDCQGTGMLTINTGVTVTCKGNVRFNGGASVRLRINGNGRLYFDTTARTSSPKTYRILNSSTEFTLYMRGTNKDTLATIEADSGGYWYGERTAGGSGLNLLDIQYGKWIRAYDGTSGTAGFAWRCNRNSAGTAATVNYLLMDTCRPILMVDSGSGRTASFTNVFKYNSEGSRFYTIVWGGYGASNTATMTNVVSDSTNNVDTGPVVVTNCIFYNDNSLAYYGTNSRNNVVAWPHASGESPGAIFDGGSSTASNDLLDCLLWARSTAGNPHFRVFSGSATTGTHTADGVVFAYSGTDGGGDLCNGVQTASSGTYTYRNTVTTLNSNGNSPGVLLAPLVDGTYTISVNNNSVAINQYGVLFFGENPGIDGHPGMVPVFKNNHAYLGGDTVVGGALVHLGSTGVSERLTAAGADYNWTEAGTAFDTAAECYESGSGTQTVPTAANETYNIPSNCIAITRNLEDWAGWWGARIGASGNANADATFANALNLMIYAARDEMYTATDMVQLMLQYLRRGWVPTATAMRGQGDDTRTPSAFGMWAPSLTTPTVVGTTASCTTNAADGIAHWVVTQSTTKPDWDRIIAGKDHTGATVSAGFSGSQAVASTSIAIDISGATLGGGDYYIHVAHSADATTNGDAGQAAYLRTSEPVTSSAFQAATNADFGLTLTLALRA